MRHKTSIRSRAFSLVELLVAITFICIAFFGYVALHARLLHSGQRLEEREKIRAVTDYMEAVNYARATSRFETALNLTAMQPDLRNTRVLWYSTDMRGGDIRWREFVPEDQIEALDQVMVRRAAACKSPYTYSWMSR